MAEPLFLPEKEKIRFTKSGKTCMLEDAQKADKGDLKSIMGIRDTNQKTKKIEMTSGSLWKNIFLFSVPLMFAQLLEVMLT